MTNFERAMHEDDAITYVTMKMREAGASVLDDPDASFSKEDFAEAVYIAMSRARKAEVATLSQQTEMAAPLDEGWLELGFDSELATVEGPPGLSLSHPDANQIGRLVVSWMRETEQGIELSFDPPYQ